MIHATKRAIEAVATRQTGAVDNLTGKRHQLACGGGDTTNRGEVFTDSDGLAIARGERFDESQYPTCPTCRVLLDAALEGHDLTAQFAKRTAVAT